MNSFEYLTAHDIKPSVQRLAIMDYLMSHSTHPTADEIYNALSVEIPTLSKTTIYNTLKLFTANGVAQSITIEANKERFDADTSVHAHFQCKVCGKIYDAPLQQKTFPGEKIFKDDGHEVDEAYLYYRGICKNCKK